MTQRSCYIVTGGAGFVGSNLCAALAERDERTELVVVDDFRTGSFENLCDAFGDAGFPGEVIAHSVHELEWTETLKHRRPRAVFHLAAITDTTVLDEREMMRVNATMFVPIVEACASADVPLVYASSAATYGSPPQGDARVPFPTSAAGRPNNVYGFSKWAMENTHRRVAASSPARPPQVVGLRFFNVFGPGEGAKGKMASMAHQLANQVLDGHRPRLFVGGEQARDQVPVEDVVSCCIAAAGLDGPAEPGIYNLGSGVATSFNAIADAVRAGLGLSEADRPTEYFEMPASVRAFYQDYTCADMSETERALGWRPTTEPSEAIRRLAQSLSAKRGNAG